LNRASVVFLLGIVITMTPIGGAQTPTEEAEPRPVGGLTFVDELEVTVVNIIAHVTDGKDRPVTDLTREDFRILQDGVEKEITNFQLYTEEVYRSHVSGPAVPWPTSSPSQDAAPLPEPRPVYMVLYVDNENSHPIDRNRVLAQAREFVRANLNPPVEMMVVSYQKSFKILQPFTSDPSEVLGALRELRDYAGGYPEREKTRREIADGMQVHSQQQASRLDGKSNASTWEQSDYYQRTMAFAEEEANDLTFSIDALRATISSIAGLDGKKGIIYISNGLPMVPGLDLFTLFNELFKSDSMVTQINRFDRTSTFNSLVSIANSHDINFYTIGAGGLEMVGMGGAKYAAPLDPGIASVGADNYLDSLRFIADSTGGFAVVETNDFAPGFERIVQDMYTYYSLGYGLNMTGTDRVHRIKVTLPDHRGYRIRYRRRFVEKSVETRVLDKVLTGLMFDLDENPLDVNFEAETPSPTGGGRSIVPFELSFPVRNIALLPDGGDYVGHVTYFIAARDEDGNQSDVVQHQREVRVPATDYEVVQNKRLAIMVNLLMNPGHQSVVVGLLDNLTRQSSYLTTSVTVKEEE
jgi:VWFA-related protein